MLLLGDVLDVQGNCLLLLSVAHLPDLVLEGGDQAMHTRQLIHDALHLCICTAAEVGSLLLQHICALHGTCRTAGQARPAQRDISSVAVLSDLQPAFHASSKSSREYHGFGGQGQSL